MTGRRALVTGAGGLIGRHVVKRLAAAGYEVHGSGRVAPSIEGLAAGHATDALDPIAMRALLASTRPSELVHLAWTTAHGAYWTDESNLDWIGATLRLLQDFRTGGGRRAVLIGSCTEYDWMRAEPLAEHTTVSQPATLYGASKLATGLAACAYGEAVGLEVAWARVFHIYGPGEDDRRIVPQLMLAAHAGKPLTLRQPRNVMDYMHVDDVAGAIAALLGARLVGACNIGTGLGVTPAEIGDIIGQLAGRACYAVPQEDEQPEPLHVVSDVARLRDEVGFTPSRSLHEGLEETHTWFLDQAKGARR